MFTKYDSVPYVNILLNKDDLFLFMNKLVRIDRQLFPS